MALTIDGKGTPIKVTGTCSASTSVHIGVIKIRIIWWFNPTTAGDLCSVKDGNGRDIVPLRCDTNGNSVFFPIYDTYDGITVNDMDSGTLYIYHR